MNNRMHFVPTDGEEVLRAIMRARPWDVRVIGMNVRDPGDMPPLQLVAFALS